MGEEKKLTEEQVNMLHYFHFEKGDLTRWCHWEETLALLQEVHPEIYDAWHRLISAQRTLDTLIRNLDYEEGEYES